MLDVTLFAPDGLPNLVLHVDPQDHQLLVEAASAASCGLIRRIEDYYQDAIFLPEELDALELQIMQLKSSVSHNIWMYVCDPILLLITLARRRRSELRFIAD